MIDKYRTVFSSVSELMNNLWDVKYDNTFKTLLELIYFIVNTCKWRLYWNTLDTDLFLIISLTSYLLLWNRVIMKERIFVCIKYWIQARYKLEWKLSVRYIPSWIRVLYWFTSDGVISCMLNQTNCSGVWYHPGHVISRKILFYLSEYYRFRAHERRVNNYSKQYNLCMITESISFSFCFSIWNYLQHFILDFTLI
jgi:hypothetical protein